MRVRIIAPAHNAGAGDPPRQQVSQPKHTIGGCPCLLPMAIEPVNRDNTSGSGQYFW